MVQWIANETRGVDSLAEPVGGVLAAKSAMTGSVQPVLPEVISRPRGSELSFEAVFTEHAPYVLRVLPRLGVGSADTDDVAQEVFLAVHQGLRDFEGRSRVRTWIYGICLRVAGNYRRKAHRRREVRGLDVEVADPPTQADGLDQDHSRKLLAKALDGLSERKREVFVLYEIEELSMAEVAEAVGCPLFTAYARLYAARREMKQALSRHVSPGGRP